MDKDTYELLWMMLRNALDRDTLSPCLQDVLSEIEDAPLWDRDAEWHHIRGYALYCMGREHKQEAASCFREALRLESDHVYAQLYLAHCYYDDGH